AIGAQRRLFERFLVGEQRKPTLPFRPAHAEQLARQYALAVVEQALVINVELLCRVRAKAYHNAAAATQMRFEAFHFVPFDVRQVAEKNAIAPGEIGLE